MSISTQQFPPCFVNDLPDEVLVQIFRNLTQPQRLQTESVCRKWRQILRILWKEGHAFHDDDVNPDLVQSRLRGNGGIYCLSPSCSCVVREHKRRWPYLYHAIRAVCSRAGDSLTRITISNYRELRFTSLDNIGQSCPNLQQLYLRNVEIVMIGSGESMRNIPGIRNLRHLECFALELVTVSRRKDAASHLLSQCRSLNNKQLHLVAQLPRGALRRLSVCLQSWASTPRLKRLVELAKQHGDQLEVLRLDMPVKRQSGPRGDAIKNTFGAAFLSRFTRLRSLCLSLSSIGSDPTWPVTAGLLKALSSSEFVDSLETLWLHQASLDDSTLKMLLVSFPNLSTLTLTECEMLVASETCFRSHSGDQDFINRKKSFRILSNNHQALLRNMLAGATNVTIGHTEYSQIPKLLFA